jgi:multiple sugar transport system ATP-binding protein
MGRAIVRDPAVFLMDEPLSNLDAKLRVQMRAEIARLHRRLEATTLYVTHDQVEAMTMGDRVAVMKDGTLQQTDEPSTLYNSPDNLFVAGFIGAPAMNLRRARLDSDNGTWAVQLGQNRLPLTDGVLAARPALAGYDGAEIVVGIRPEAMEDASIPGTDAPRIVAEAELTEALGSDLLVHFHLDTSTVDTGDPAVIDDIDDTALMIARVDPRSSVRSGDRIELAVDTERLHFFDPETTLAIRS